MECKKIFFPIGLGDKLQERIHGALLVNKWFNSHISILSCNIDTEMVRDMEYILKSRTVYNEFLKATKAEVKENRKNIIKIFEDECKKLDTSINNNYLIENSADLQNLAGDRTKLISKQCKYCDLVIAAVPPNGKITGTFETTIFKSGKNSIIIPREMTKFNPEHILLYFTPSIESSKTLTDSIFLLKKAKKVSCLLSKEFAGEDVKKQLELYLATHGIKIEFEIYEDNKRTIPGETILKISKRLGIDLIVTGSATEHSSKEIFFIGSSQYFLKNTTVPIFM